MYWIAFPTSILNANNEYKNNISWLWKTYGYDNTEYTFISSLTSIQLSFIEVINEIKNKINYYYETKTVVSVYDASFTNITPPYYQHLNIFEYYINPKGGGQKTVITTSRLESIFDIIAKSGGLFSPSLTAWTLIISILLSTTICGYFGCAKNEGLLEEDRKKVALFLQEMGIISSKQFKNANKFKEIHLENMNKIDS